MIDNPINVLLIDDNEDDYIIIRRLLTDAPHSGSFQWWEGPGFTLDWASSYDTGLEAIHQNQHDVYLLDYYLGKRTGLELLHEAKSSHCQAPLILLTGQENYEVDVEAMEAGAADYLIKDQISAPLLQRSLRYAIQHQRTWEALRESEARYSSLFKNNHAAMLLIDPKSGDIVDANPAACAFYGYSAEDLTGKNITAINMLSQPHVLPEMEMATSAPRQSLNFRHRLASGEERDVEVYSGPITVRGKQLLYSIIHDITERQQTTEALQHLVAGTSAVTGKQFFETLVQQLADWLQARWALVGELDPGPPKKVQPLAFWSDGKLAPAPTYLLKGTPCERAHKKKGLCVFPRNLVEMFPTDTMLSDMGADWYAGIPLLDSEGRTVGILCALHHHAIDPPANIDQVFSIFSHRAGVEIVRKRAEEAHTRLAAIVESSDDAIIGKSLDGTILTWNIGAERMYGYSATEVIGRPISILAPPDRPDEVFHILEKIQRGEVVDSFETIRMRKNGERFHASLNISPIKDEGGNIVGASTIGRDITERKRMESQLREYAENLEQLVAQKVHELEEERAKMIHTARLAALGEMATGVAHELNQPLTAMLFEADYLKTLAQRSQTHPEENVTEPNWDGIYQVGDNLTQDIDRCRRIIDHLRTFGRAADQEPSAVDLNQVIENSFILTGERLRQHAIDLQVDLAPDLPPITADPNRLEQVFINLISNAEYALEVMKQRVTLGAVERENYKKKLHISTRLAHVSESQTDWIVAQVQDNGCGISEAAQEHIFEPFFTTKPVGEGTGLGMSISYGIVTESGGSITYESTENEGTTFTLRFPASDAQPNGSGAEHRDRNEKEWE